MRTTTIMSVALLAASTAALAQVASTPVEQKTGQAVSDANAAAPANAVSPASDVAATPDNTVAPEPKAAGHPH